LITEIERCLAVGEVYNMYIQVQTYMC